MTLSALKVKQESVDKLYVFCDQNWLLSDDLHYFDNRTESLDDLVCIERKLKYGYVFIYALNGEQSLLFFFELRTASVDELICFERRINCFLNLSVLKG